MLRVVILTYCTKIISDDVIRKGSNCIVTSTPASNSEVQA